MIDLFIVNPITYSKRCARRCCGEYKNDFSLICSDAMLDVVQPAEDIQKIMWFFYIYDDGATVPIHNNIM